MRHFFLNRGSKAMLARHKIIHLDLILRNESAGFPNLCLHTSRNTPTHSQQNRVRGQAPGGRDGELDRRPHHRLLRPRRLPHQQREVQATQPAGGRDAPPGNQHQRMSRFVDEETHGYCHIITTHSHLTPV